MKHQHIPYQPMAISSKPKNLKQQDSWFREHGMCTGNVGTSEGIQCVTLDSASFVIYPELEATEARFSALKRYLCSFYFRIDN